MNRPLGRLTTMLLALTIVPFLVNLQTTSGPGKTGIAYARDGGGGGSRGGDGGSAGEGSGRDASAGGRGGVEAGRGSETADRAEGRGESPSQEAGRDAGKAHGHAGHGVGSPASGQAHSQRVDRERGPHQDRETEFRGRGATGFGLETEARYREAQAEDRELGMLAKAATPR
jgi:hypothetical protein